MQPLGIYRVKVMYDHFCVSLSITPLSQCGNADWSQCIPTWVVWTWWFNSHCLYLFAKRLAEQRVNKEPLMYNLQTFEHIPNYTDSKWKTYNGPVHNRSLHWLSCPFVTLAHLVLLIRMECIFSYSWPIHSFTSCYLHKMSSPDFQIRHPCCFQ